MVSFHPFETQARLSFVSMGAMVGEPFYYALSGLDRVMRLLPRAVPWANLLRPVGAWELRSFMGCVLIEMHGVAGLIYCAPLGLSE